MNVLRGENHLLIDGLFFLMDDIKMEVIRRIKESGSNNIAFDMPPFFYSGCPYGEAVLALGCSPVKPPPTFTPEYLPQSKTPVWRSRMPTWPVVFGVSFEDYEDITTPARSSTVERIMFN